MSGLNYAHAQSGIEGTVYNNKMEPLPFINVNIKEVQRQAKSDEEGKFTILLQAGRYEVVYSAFGYKSLNTIVIVREGEMTTQTAIVEESMKSINAVNVKAKWKDPSKEIIRKVMVNKKNLQKASASYSFQAYIKANQSENKDIAKSKKQKEKQKEKEEEKKAELKKEEAEKKEESNSKFSKLLAKMKDEDTTKRSKPPEESFKQFAEVMLSVHKSYPNKIKEERKAVNMKGDKRNFFYLSCTEGDFDFYDNLIRVRALGEVSYLSPFSPGGYAAYRYKHIKTYKEDGIFYHRIKFKPNSISNALLKGEVIIQDSSWAITYIKASFPNAHTPSFKRFEIEASYALQADKAWLPTQYSFNYERLGKVRGNTEVQFSNYNLDTIYNKKFFNSELSATSQEAYKRDSSYWKETRPVPLTEDEIKVIHYKDSIYQATHSDAYRDSVEQAENKITFLNIAWKGQTISNWRKEQTWYIPSIPELWRPIAVGGGRYGPGFRYRRKFENKKAVRISPYINYGPLNKDFRGNVSAYYLFDPFRRRSISCNIGRGVSNLFWNDAFINLFGRNNYFLKDRMIVSGRSEIVNGLYIQNTVEFGVRRSMNHYKFSNFWDSLFNRDINTLLEKPLYFPTYTAFFNEVELSYTFKQKYIREPFEKVILGSKFPTAYVKWRKGIPGVFGSVINYDYIEAGIRQKVNMGTLGVSNYNLKYGNYINENRIEAADFKFIARGNPGIFFNPMNSFQAMDSTFALFQGFVEGHYVHQFNGALLSKIPYAKHLKLFESAGGGLLIAPERNLRYIEAFAGLEKSVTIFRQRLKLGLFAVASYANQFKNPIQLKFSIRSYDVYNDMWN